MSRARHRLTGKREATHNAPVSSDHSLDAFIDNDTYVYHVNGPIDGGLTGGNGNTGSTSDALMAAVEINSLLNQTSDVVSYVGSNQWNISSNQSTDGEGPYYPYWPYYFNFQNVANATTVSGPTADGWLGSTARRYYAYCDLDNYATSSGLCIENGDLIRRAHLVLTLRAEGAPAGQSYQYSESSELGGQFLHDRRTPEDDLGGNGNWPYYDNNVAKTYRVYKVVKPFSGASMGNITWWGWSGGIGDNVADTYWEEAGGSSLGSTLDIEDVSGISASVCVPDTTWVGCGYPGLTLYPDREQGGVPVPLYNQPTSNRPPPGQGTYPVEVRTDITHIVQDALDNESGIIRLAMYGNNDTNIGGTSADFAIDLNDVGNFRHLTLMTTAKQTLIFSSASETDPQIKPRIEIDFTRR
jgi:hypothetical protein